MIFVVTEQETPDIKKYKLTREEETSLFYLVKEGQTAQKQIQEGKITGDERRSLESKIKIAEDAKKRIFLSNLKLLDDIKYKCFESPMYPLEDIKQDAAIKLMDCIEHYDPQRDVSFATFASKCIDGYIIDTMAVNSSILSEKKGHRKNIWKAERFQSDFYKLYGREAETKDLMEYMGIGESLANNLMNNKYSMISYEAQLDNTDDDMSGKPKQDHLVTYSQKSCPEETLEKIRDHNLSDTVNELKKGGILHEQVSAQLSDIMIRICTKKEKIILEYRFGFKGEPMTDEQIAQMLGMDVIQVEQIWATALVKLETPCRKMGLNQIFA